MKKLFVLLMCASLVGCGANTNLKLDKSMVGNKHSYSLDNSFVSNVPFKEETMKGFLVMGVASFLAAGVSPYGASHGQDYGHPASADQQMLVQPYNPQKAILAEAGKVVQRELGWTKAQNGQSDFIIVLKSPSWGMRHGGIKVAHYKVYYKTYVEIRETKTKEHKSTSFICGYGTEPLYSYDEVYANNASVVKDVVNKAVAACAKQISTELKDKIKRDSAVK